jgi:hypothetical protein
VSHILASFFDPSNNGFDGDDFVRIGPIAVLAYIVARWLWKKGGGRRLWLKFRGKVDDEAESYIARILVGKLDEFKQAMIAEIHARTETIQPGSNSGESLSDNNRLTEWVVAVLEILVHHSGLSSADIPPKPDTRHSARTRSTDHPNHEE